MSVYDQIHLWGSQWWRNWIEEQIFPSWNFFQSSINEIYIVLSEIYIYETFFELCIDSITPQNDDWEYQFDSIFLNDSNEEIK
jgi:hypothetical protein